MTTDLDNQVTETILRARRWPGAPISESGYKLLFNVERGGQVIFHLHTHLFGGWGPVADLYFMNDEQEI
jgi:diadenosine tetraphosphate (Ap4A) HIT family hydrolase